MFTFATCTEKNKRALKIHHRNSRVRNSIKFKNNVLASSLRDRIKLELDSDFNKLMQVLQKSYLKRNPDLKLIVPNIRMFVESVSETQF